jgi:hypothetical protein
MNGASWEGKTFIFSYRVPKGKGAGLLREESCEWSRVGGVAPEGGLVADLKGCYGGRGVLLRRLSPAVQEGNPFRGVDFCDGHWYFADESVGVGEFHDEDGAINADWGYRAWFAHVGQGDWLSILGENRSANGLVGRWDLGEYG